MATKTKAIEVKVDERLALEIACRNGNRLSLAPAVARLKGIVVKG